MFFHLKIGNAKAQQTAGQFVFFQHGHFVSGARQLLCACQSAGARTDDGDPFAGFYRRRLRDNPPFVPSVVGDGALNGFNGHRIVVNV